MCDNFSSHIFLHRFLLLDMEEWLKQMSLEHLTQMFQEEGFDLDTIISSDLEDLKGILNGIVKKAGEKLKLLNAIRELQKQHSVTSVISNETNILTGDAVLIGESIEYTTNIQEVSDLKTNAGADKLVGQSTSQTFISVSSQQIISPMYGNFNSLMEYLQSNKMGIALLSCATKKTVLTSAERQKLVQIIVDHLIQSNETLKNIHFERVAHDICKIFTLESKDVYYVPPLPKKNSAGKLVDRYRNQSYFLRQHLQKSKVTQINEHPVTTESDDSKIKWLKMSQEPWSKVELYWGDTFSIRDSERCQQTAIYEFVSKWPVLKNKLGYILVSLLVPFVLLLIFIHIM